MTLTMLSGYLEDFLAMKRTRAEADARSGPERRQLRYNERLLRSFLAFWQARGCPWPIRAALALDWAAVGSHPHHPYRDHHRMWAVRAFLYQVRAFEVTDISPATYSEKMIDTPLVKATSTGWNAEAMHHVDAQQTGKNRWIAIVDALGK